MYCIYRIVYLHTEIIFKTIILFSLDGANKQLTVYYILHYILCGGTKMPRVLHRVIFIYLYKLNFVKEQKLQSQFGKSSLHVNLLCPFLEINLSSVFVFVFLFLIIFWWCRWSSCDVQKKWTKIKQQQQQQQKTTNNLFDVRVWVRDGKGKSNKDRLQAILYYETLTEFILYLHFHYHSFIESSSRCWAFGYESWVLLSEYTFDKLYNIRTIHRIEYIQQFVASHTFDGLSQNIINSIWIKLELVLQCTCIHFVLERTLLNIISNVCPACDHIQAKLIENNTKFAFNITEY